MVSDLASPWCAALEAGSTAPLGYRIRHHALLDALRSERAPLLAEFPLPDAVPAVRRIARRTADTALHQQLRADLARLASFGISGPVDVALLPAAADTDPAGVAEPIPTLGTVALLVDATMAEHALRIALAIATVDLLRQNVAPVVARDSIMPRRWQRVQQRPLRSAIYSRGLGFHAAHALMPELAPHQLLGASRTEYRQLREGERRLAAMLRDDLDESGAGLALGWLDTDAPASLRRRGGSVLPRRAGAYLAWRMTAPRVARVGLAEALRMDA